MTNPNINTQGVVTALEMYLPTDQEELALKSRTLNFVLANPDFYKRSNLTGHVTASAWVIDRGAQHILLNHHAKLDRWMQLGGHIEDDDDIQSAALREAREESGLSSLNLVSQEIFDVDIHQIPARAAAPAHLHYDIRFLMTADPHEPLRVSEESKSLEWCSSANVRQRSSERSILRMLEKSDALQHLS